MSLFELQNSSHLWSSRDLLKGRRFSRKLASGQHLVSISSVYLNYSTPDRRRAAMCSGVHPQLLLRSADSAATALGLSTRCSTGPRVNYDLGSLAQCSNVTRTSERGECRARAHAVISSVFIPALITLNPPCFVSL